MQNWKKYLICIGIGAVITAIIFSIIIFSTSRSDRQNITKLNNELTESKNTIEKLTKQYNDLREQTDIIDRTNQELRTAINSIKSDSAGLGTTLDECIKLSEDARKSIRERKEKK